MIQSISQSVVLYPWHAEGHLYAPSNMKFDRDSVKIHAEMTRHDWTKAHAEITNFMIRVVAIPLYTDSKPIEIQVTANQIGA